ncbi:hypothetical protein V8G54_032470 [Vigna mungo]|uniref:Integrase catalytic domain-containing protein n=1 Tax=Vigna mungo TaxID=3915 RepID=A0AAQ3MLM9_VIGMU
MLGVFVSDLGRCFKLRHDRLLEHKHIGMSQHRSPSPLHHHTSSRSAKPCDEVSGCGLGDGVMVGILLNGVVDHLTKNVTSATIEDTSRWMKIDAQLCIVIKSTIHSSLKQMFRSYETCSEVWAQAKLLYTNDTQRLYGVCQDLFTVIGPRNPGPMTEYLGKVHALLHDFNELLPPASTPAEELEQRSKFFMLLALYGLSDDSSHVRDQILGSPVIPNFTSTCSALLRIPSKPVIETSPHSDDSSVMATQRDDKSRSRKPGKGRPKCDHCGKPGHRIDRCYAFHGRPPRSVAMANSDPPPRPADHPTSSNTVDNPAVFNEFLRWYEDRQQSSSTTSASVARTGTPFVGLTHSLGSWVIDSGATDHITGNKSLFSSLSCPDNLPSVTMADGSRVSSHGIGTVHIFPSISIDHVLYVPGSPFNLLSVSRLTHSLNCVISFTKDSVCLLDRSSKHMIGTGCESHGLYLLRPSAHVGVIMKSPSLLHAQLGHPSLAKLQQLVPSLSKLSNLSCESCQLGKHTRSSFPRSVSQRATSPFSLVHYDIWGPSRVKSTLGFQYFVTFIDDYSRCTWLFLMKNRSELFSIFQSFFNEIKTQFGVSIRTLRSDNGREYLSQQFQHFMASHCILHQTSCAYTPQQNGVAERKNRHLIETTRTLLIHGQVPSRFWGDAVLTACYLINRMPSSVLDNKIPHSVLFPQDPLHPLPLKVFGSTCFVHDFSPGLDKLSPRSHKCVFLGFPRSQKGYKCFSPSLNRHFISADVTFDESSFYFSQLSSSYVPPPTTVDIPIVCDPLDSHSPQDRPSTPPLQVYSRRNRLPHDSPPVPPPVSPPTPANESDLPIALRKGIRSTRNPSPHYTVLSYHRLSPSFYTCLSSISSVSIPKSVGDALSHPGWRQAMLDELSALQKSGTWELVQLPSGKSVVGCRWVYAIKVGPDGTIDRLKARLVAKGYTQIFGLDYGDTFSPVAKMTSVRLFIAMAALRQWPLYQLDVKNAFLNGDLHEEIYMEQPPGFVAQGESSGLVCRLRKSLYGLKQSPRAWFGKFSGVVQQFGMTRSEADHSVFYRHSSAGCIYLIVYVDDIVLTGSDYLGISQMKQHICHHFQTKDLGKLRYFLGIEVAQSNDGIVICQRKYALDILEETGLMNCKSVETPMDPNIKLLPNQGEPFSDPERYRRLVGKLNYLTVTRPDISFAVSVVSQFLNSPCEDHWDAVVRILKYIKRSPGKGLLYGPNNDTKIVCYSDADWAGSPSDRRSTSGYCVSIGGNLISWKSKKQSVVARSSAEAEYRAMASATCELVWLKQLLSELKFGDITHMTLICDNQAALHISANSVFHERTKHIEVDCHFIREKIISGDIKTEFVNSSNQLADIFTKSLQGPRIDYLCNKLGTYDLYAPA